MFSRAFWVAAVERAVRAFAASLVSIWAVGSTALDIRAIDWGNALSVAGGAALVSLLLSLVATGVGSSASPSFVADPAPAAGPAPRVTVEPSNVKLVTPPTTRTTQDPGD